MSYDLFLEKQVSKFILKLDKESSRRILSKIKELKENPIPHDAKRLVNVSGKSFRIRVGFYRILYRIENKNKLIIVFLIDKRSKVYKK